MAIVINVIKTIEIPKHPNFLRLKKDKEGRGIQETIDLGELDEDGFEDFLNEYNKSFRKH